LKTQFLVGHFSRTIKEKALRMVVSNYFATLPDKVVNLLRAVPFTECSVKEGGLV
jgi:hypothetical protein